jgi:hypothetical protein
MMGLLLVRGSRMQAGAVAAGASTKLQRAHLVDGQEHGAMEDHGTVTMARDPVVNSCRFQRGHKHARWRGPEDLAQGAMRRERAERRRCSSDREGCVV